MKKINELKSERAELITKMEAISVSETLTDEQRSEWTGFDNLVKNIDNEIAMAERQEELNKINVTKMENNLPIVNNVKPMAENFRDWLFESVANGGKSPSFRADPILASTDTTLIEKSIGVIDVLKSPAEAALRTLGVQFYTGLTNTLVLPYMGEDTATFPGENSAASSADMTTASHALAPRRVSHTQAISKETLAQTNVNLYATIVQNLIDGVYNCVANDLFDQIQADAPNQIQTAGVTFAAIAGMEASLAYSNIGAVKYVTTPAVRATLKTTAKMANQAPIWNADNTVLGYPAYALPAANASQQYLGDFSKSVVAQWGPLEIIVDPYTSAKTGLINLTVVGLFDTGIVNPKSFIFKAIA